MSEGDREEETRSAIGRAWKHGIQPLHHLGTTHHRPPRCPRARAGPWHPSLPLRTPIPLPSSDAEGAKLMARGALAPAPLLGVTLPATPSPHITHRPKDWLTRDNPSITYLL